MSRPAGKQYGRNSAVTACAGRALRAAGADTGQMALDWADSAPTDNQASAQLAARRCGIALDACALALASTWRRPTAREVPRPKRCPKHEAVPDAVLITHHRL